MRMRVKTLHVCLGIDLCMQTFLCLVTHSLFSGNDMWPLFLQRKNTAGFENVSCTLIARVFSFGAIFTRSVKITITVGLRELDH
jgi:hypothetical protein